MDIIRFAQPGQAPRVGVVAAGQVTELAVRSVAELLRLRYGDFRDTCEHASGRQHVLTEVELLAPTDGRTEVWAAGVTYKASQVGRVSESSSAGSCYDNVYHAPRPELFFKSAAWRVVGPGQPVAVRADSEIDVPEPELALVLNRHGEICGFTICNDVSSRTIEGQNPLYLPQAKVYLGGCAVGPVIRPAWIVENPYALDITLSITRDGTLAWHGCASTASLHRTFDELIDYLYRAEVFPDGAILSTGTSLVPELPFTLATGDVVTIGIAGIGALTNPVVRGRPEWADLAIRIAE